MKKISKFYRFLIYILPAVLFFSYWPVISLGSNESMNFEFSLPLIWLVVFDVAATVILIKKKLIKGILKEWRWLIFPIFMTISVLWSLNSLRGILVTGILWLIYLAIYAFWTLKSLFSEFSFKERFWKIFFASSLFACAWCFLQCILDIVGVSREISLMCAGCTYKMFGFSHPNGFAIEPQFMGNLLLAPAIISIYFLVENNYNSIFRGRVARARRCGARALILGRNLRKPLEILLSVVFITTLFLTFSRGAIYAFIVAMIFMTVMKIVQTKKWKALIVWPIILVAFLFALNLQGIMAEVGPTSDTYIDGVAKSLNHLSLGTIDIRKSEEVGLQNNVEQEIADEKDALSSNELVEESVFDGYVEESTDTRVRLNDEALKVWSKDFNTMLFGVGVGGAGQALYVNGLSVSPKEIIQNQYISLLLEVGLVGIALMIFTMILVIRAVLKNSVKDMLLALIVAYGITLLFFSGLPNALHIYLLPALFISLYGKSLHYKM